MIRRFAGRAALAVALCTGPGLGAPVEITLARPVAPSRSLLDALATPHPIVPDNRGIAGSIGDVYFPGTALLDARGAPRNDFSIATGASLSVEAIRTASNALPAGSSSDWLEARARPFAGVREAIETGTLDPVLHLGPAGSAGSLVQGPSVPLPSALWMGLSGMATLGLAALMRRRAR